tara:strand:- start:97 stop:432 length:336 start_codon:yes stop_codon:yes gene_type:complete
MRALQAQELEQVSGGAGPIGGAVLGGFTYLAMSAMNGHEIQKSELVGAIVFGGVTSGLSVLGGPMVGIANTVRTVHATAIGALSGAAAQGSISSMGGNNMSTGSHIMDKHK